MPKSLISYAEPCGTTAEPHTPYKGSVAASAPHASPYRARACEAVVIDLTPIFTPTTADAIRDAWITRRDGLNPQPIREIYRATPHAGFRAALAHLMTEEQA